jgi:DNA ligase-associated metallophosphoesterase
VAAAGVEPGGPAGMLRVEWAGEPLALLADKAVLLEAHATLLVADAHVGKAVSFRRLGVPVPRGTTSETLSTLDALIRRHRPRRIVFLGDFLHSARAHAASTLGALARWRTEHAGLELTLVRGNHDEHAGDPPSALGIEVLDGDLRLGPWRLTHLPSADAAAYTLCGHLHPCVTLGRGFERLRLPCFHFGAAVGVLPAFGAFTGMHPVRPSPGDCLYVVAGDEVRPLAGGPATSG